VNLKKRQYLTHLKTGAVIHNLSTNLGKIYNRTKIDFIIF
jgi:hypothetical protein